MLLTRNFYPVGSWRGTLSEMDRLRREMGRVLGMAGEGRESSAPAGAGVYPLLNVSEDKDAFYVRAELPGVASGDIDISVVGRNLAIAGTRKPPQLPEGARYHRRERGFPAFNRALTLPADLEVTKVKAISKDGVLTIVLPKAEAAKPKQITVEAS
ncbi:MAG: Hsp20/alpha crystallin family protein [Deltaproteobacteria bacterium]|nr:Hsp20/alpha crystallin family protein [Deltaproteobacteria bacterium]